MGVAVFVASGGGSAVVVLTLAQILTKDSCGDCLIFEEEKQKLDLAYVTSISKSCQAISNLAIFV